MRLVHEITCVGCGKVEYVPSGGKSARSMKGICEECDNADEKAKKDESPPKPESVSARRTSKA